MHEIEMNIIIIFTNQFVKSIYKYRTANPNLFNLECCLSALSNQDTCIIRTV